jgi:hypothetical protein
VANGKVVRWGTDDPTTVRERVSWYRDAKWLQPLCLAALMVIALTALSWPVSAIARRHYRARLAVNSSDRKAFRLVCLFSWLVLVTLVGWLSLVADFIPLVDNDGSRDWRTWLLQIGGAGAIFGLAALAVWNLLRVWRSVRGRFSKLWSALTVLAAASILWMMLVFHLVGFGANY